MTMFTWFGGSSELFFPGVLQSTRAIMPYSLITSVDHMAQRYIQEIDECPRLLVADHAVVQDIGLFTRDSAMSLRASALAKASGSGLS